MGNVNEQLLLELKKSTLVNGSKNGKPYKDTSKGVNRFARRTKSRVANSVREFNEIDMNDLFKRGILNVNLRVTGETDTYMVSVKFGGVTTYINEEVEKTGMFDLRAIKRALITCFNRDDVYVMCTCPDWKYRFGYYSMLGDYNSDPVQQAHELKPGKHGYEPGETNPDDNLGFGCKHVLLVLNNNSWLGVVAQVIYNYVNYMEKHRHRQYIDMIYPEIYGEYYSGDMQDDDLGPSPDELETDTDEIDTSNKWAREKDKFKKGNKRGIRFASNGPKKELRLDDEEEEPSEEVPEEEK